MAPPLQVLQGWRIPASMPRRLEDCALIVPTFRRPRELVRLLEAVVNMPDAPAEIWIMDGAPDLVSNDVIQIWAGKRRLPCELAWLASPPGSPLQRNAGLDATALDLVFFLEDDCLPAPGYFQSLRQVFIDDTSREVGAVCAPLSGQRRPIFGAERSLPFTPLFRGLATRDLLEASVFAYRRESLQTNRFSEFFYSSSQGEDLELALRMSRHWKIEFCERARITRQPAASAGLRQAKLAARNWHFIWSRHFCNGSVTARIGYWADHAWSMACRLAAFAVQPCCPGHLTEAAGSFLGALGCFLSPPAHHEPQVRQQYEVAWVEPVAMERVRTQA